MRQWAIRIANAGLFVFCCWLAAGIGTDLLGEVLMPGAQAAVDVRPPPVTSTAGRAWAERETILNRNLFGARLAGEPVVEEPEPIDEDLEETKLPLKLLGTVAGENEQVSNAAILDESDRKHQVVFVGSRLRNHDRVEVIRIERKRVVLQNGAKLEELSLDEDAEQGTRQVASRPNPRRKPRARPANRRERPKKPAIAQKLEQAGRSPASLFSQARIVPKYENGGMVGIQLNDIEDGSLYEKIGLSDGDVITSLNDIKIDSASASAKILTEFTEADEFMVTLEDGGTIEVAAPDLEALLAED